MIRRQIQYLPLIFVSFLSLVTTSNAQDLNAESFHRAMDSYVGIWQGEYRIYSGNDELINQFKVNRNYWWDGAVLQGRVSYDFGQAKQTYYHRVILSDGVPFSFVTETANSEEIRSALKGEFLKGTMVWTRVLPKGSLPVRISERIVQSDSGRFIEFWGNQEAKDAKGESMLVRIEGFAAYVPDSREVVIPTEDVKTSDTPERMDVEMDPDETPAVKENKDLMNRDERLQKLDPERRAATPQAEAKPKPEKKSKSKKKEIPAEPKPEQTPIVIGEANPPIEQPVVREPEIKQVVEDPEISKALNQLNVVGINDKPGETCIVVDYFQLYNIGDKLDMDKECIFTGVDSQYLYFKDGKGYQYRLYRKDAVPK